MRFGPFPTPSARSRRSEGCSSGRSLRTALHLLFLFLLSLMFPPAVRTGGEGRRWLDTDGICYCPFLWVVAFHCGAFGRDGDWPCRSSSRYARVQGRITTSSTSLLCSSWHVTAAEAARLMFCVRPVWNSGSLSDPLSLTALSVFPNKPLSLCLFSGRSI